MTTSIHPSIWTNQAPYRIALDALLHFQWSVFPLDEEKRPPKTGQTHPDGQPKRLSWKRLQTQWASTEEISHWHHTYKPAAWAIITGAISKIVLLDFDGEAGQQTRERLGLIHPHVQTGSGGHHVYFRHPGWPVPTLNSKSSHELGKRWPGLDIRADGGYAAFCGHNTSGQYLWLRDPDPEELEILPTELRRFLGLSEPPPAIRERFVNAARTAQPDHQQPDTVNITPTVQSSHQQPGTVNPTPTVSAQTLLSRATIALNNEGKGRNDTGFWLACQLRDNGYTRAYAQIIMREYVEFVPPQNTKGLFEPYTLEEAFASIASAYQGPARDPWSVPPPPALPRKGKNEEKNVGKFCPIRVVDLMAEFTQGDAPTPTPEGETQRSMDNEHTPGDATTPTPEGEVQCSMDTGHTPGDAPTPGSERQCSPATQSSGAYVEREDLPEIFIHQEQLRAVVDCSHRAVGTESTEPVLAVGAARTHWAQ